MIEALRKSLIDADAADWTTVAAYLLAAALSVRADVRAGMAREPRERLFWRATAALLLFLGVNELLDLQTLLTTFGREHAIANGWYEERRQVQFLFVSALSVAALASGIIVAWVIRRTHATVRLALVGLASVALFVVLRAASFHHLDELFGDGGAPFDRGWSLEMAGILIVASAAASYNGQRYGIR